MTVGALNVISKGAGMHPDTVILVLDEYIPETKFAASKTKTGSQHCPYPVAQKSSHAASKLLSSLIVLLPRALTEPLFWSQRTSNSGK